LRTDDSLTQLRGELHKANDGQFGTQAWRAKAPKDSKKRPWVEIHFPGEREVNRFRFSSNREYYFETDYLSQGNYSKFPTYRISVQQPDGGWKEVAASVKAKGMLDKNPDWKTAADSLHEIIADLKEEGPRHSFVGRFFEPPVTRVLQRGSPENPRDEVMPAGFEIMDGQLGLTNETPEHERRLAYADWLVREDHPLTARVMANRVWQHVFGAGLVSTGSDFGRAGAEPSHPELLDWLAAEFVDREWSTKKLIRLLVTSDAFRRSSAPAKEAMQADASSLFLWRYPPRRIEAEVIRDGILQASGKLDRSLGGRGYRIHNVKKTYAQWEVVDNHGPETWRRMLYQERMRRVDDRIFTAFDFPDCGQVRAKRPVSTTPLQALNLLNSSFVVEQADHLADRAREEAGAETEAQIDRLYALLLTRTPSDDEKTACVEIAEGHGLAIVARSLINTNEFAFLP